MKRRTRRKDLKEQYARKKFQLSTEEYYLLREHPCFYCGSEIETESGGLDRLDPRFGYTPENVVPCCLDCNIARSDRFSPEEMRIIGLAIRRVKLRREENLVQQTEREARAIGAWVKAELIPESKCTAIRNRREGPLGLIRLGRCACNCCCDCECIADRPCACKPGCGCRCGCPR